MAKVSDVTDRTIATTVSWAFAGAFALAGLLAYVPNPLLGPESLFVTNGPHNAVHFLTAVGFAIVALWGSSASILFMKSFGAVYMLVGLLGFLVLRGSAEGQLLGVVHINQMDNFLHVGLAAAILGSGFLLASRR